MLCFTPWYLLRNALVGLVKVEDLKKRCAARVGKVVDGRWRLERFVGLQRSFAVYTAKDANETLGVLRVMHPEVAKNQQMRADFILEDYVCSTLNHEALVQVLASGSDASGAPYLVREVLQGEPVRAWLEKSGGYLPVPQAMSVVEQVLRVLDLAHRNQIHHGNISPSNLYRTREGMIKVMNFGGRPKGGAFMAPEQVGGETGNTGAKTDVWQTGALLFNLLTGRSPYRGDRDPASSTRGVPGIRALSDVLVGAPSAIEEMLVVALNPSPEERFNRVAEFLTAFDEARETLQSLDLADVVPRKSRLGQSGNSDGLLDFDSSGYSNLVVSNMNSLFGQLDQCRSMRAQHGLNHEETQSHFRRAFKAASYALDEHDGPLFWSVTPYSLVAGDHSLWEPGSPGDSICYALYAAGVRAMGFAQGLKEGEFVDWLALMTLDPFNDLRMEDDLGTYLWDADFGEALFKIEVVEGGASVEAFNRKKLFVKRSSEKLKRPVRSGVVEAWQGWQPVRRQGSGRTREQMQDVWACLQNVQDDAGREKAKQDVDVAWNAGGALPLSVVAPAPAERRALTKAFESPAGDLDGPFSVLAAKAFVKSDTEAMATTIKAGLSSVLQDLCEANAELGLEMVLQMVESLPQDASDGELLAQKNRLLEGMLSEDSARCIYEQLLELRLAERDIYLNRLIQFTEMLPASMASTVIQVMYSVSETSLRQVLLSYLRVHGEGHEEALGGLFTVLSEPEGLMLADLLTELDNEKAIEAIAKGVASPHPLVRVQALEHMDETSGMQVREELRTLLEDENETVRLTALDAILKYKIKAAGPYLVLRIRQPDFFEYSSEERKKSLLTLAALRPDRAERICVEILLDTGQVRSTSLDETRVHATEILVDVAHSKFAFEALKQTALGHERRTSDVLRTAAAEALNQIAMKIRARKENKGREA